MSYEVMVFEPEAAPTDHAAFMEWYREQMEFGEPYSYGDLDVTTDRLRAWFLEFEPQFPADDKVTVGGEVRKAKGSTTAYGIAWKHILFSDGSSGKPDAYDVAFELAEKYGLGFFNVASEKERVWLPESGKLVLAHEGEAPEPAEGWWELVLRMFRRG